MKDRWRGEMVGGDGRGRWREGIGYEKTNMILTASSLGEEEEKTCVIPLLAGEVSQNFGTLIRARAVPRQEG